MPKDRLPDREKQICLRVRQARELKGITQQKCAELTGIERSTLANYEAAVTPLAYEEAKRICYRLNINQRWLATGSLPQFPYLDVSPNLEFSIKQNCLFSKAFDEVLQPRIQEQINDLVKWIGEKAFLAGKYEDAALDNFALVGEDHDPAAGFYTIKALSMQFHWMPEQFQAFFAEALIEAEKKFQYKYGAEIKRLVRKRQAQSSAILTKETGKNELTKKAYPLTNEDVQPVLPKLIERLKRATKQRGSKAALAKWLGVHRQMVTDWLSGKQEPGGETTLRLLQWVEQQERQK